jgi:hypothetical protein
MFLYRRKVPLNGEEQISNHCGVTCTAVRKPHNTFHSPHPQQRVCLHSQQTAVPFQALPIAQYCIICSLKAEINVTIKVVI